LAREQVRSRTSCGPRRLQALPAERGGKVWATSRGRCVGATTRLGFRQVLIAMTGRIGTFWLHLGRVAAQATGTAAPR
jgi:hypothetical protein